jgi:hypothetical protein
LAVATGLGVRARRARVLQGGLKDRINRPWEAAEARAGAEAARTLTTPSITPTDGVLSFPFTLEELQARCALLEREVESLRQENTWLKGLVVGGSESTPMPEQPTSFVGAPTGIDVGAGQKRKRDEEIADLFQDMV